MSIKSLTEPALSIDTSSPMAIVGIMAVFAQLRVDTIRENTRRGLAYARAQGRVGGRPTVMGSERIDAALRMKAQGQSNAHIATVLGVKHVIGTPSPCPSPEHPFVLIAASRCVEGGSQGCRRRRHRAATRSALEGLFTDEGVAVVRPGAARRCRGEGRGLPMMSSHTTRPEDLDVPDATFTRALT